jgi:hypothetical protein
LLLLSKYVAVVALLLVSSVLLLLLGCCCDVPKGDWEAFEPAAAMAKKFSRLLRII